MKKRIFIPILLFVFCCSLGFHSSNAQSSDIVHEYSMEEYPDWVVFDKNVIFEIFTATWCGWCYKAYDLFEALRDTYGEKTVTNIRYHCQDEISMETIKDRIYYYGISGYPTVIANGNTKQTGVSDDWLEKFSKVIENELSESPDVALHSNITVRDQEIFFDVFLYSPHRQIEGDFMGLTMVSGVTIDDSVHDYVAESIFPSFDGFHMILQPKKIYYLQFYLPMTKSVDSKFYSTLCIFQNLATKEIYNSQFCSLYSHMIVDTTPKVFEQDVPRDHQFELQFHDGIIIKTLQSIQFYFLDQEGDVVESEWSYNATLKSLTISPRQLLKPKTGYVLVVKGGEDSFKSVNQQNLYHDFFIPFKTSAEPEINLYYSTSLLTFDNVSVIDEPSSYVYVEETHGNDVRLKVNSQARWIQCNPSEIHSSEGYIYIQLDPLFMANGKNTGTIEIQSLVGTHFIKVEAYRLSDKYPSIRLDPHPLITTLNTIQISGKTDGYKVFYFEKEIPVQNDGRFTLLVALKDGMNHVLIESKNMRGNTSTYPAIILKINPQSDS